MSLLKADQVRRELFVAYSQQIATLLGETEDGEPIESHEADENASECDMKGEDASLLSKRFRVSYARQHLLRQRALRLPASDGKAGGAHLTSSTADNETAAGATATPEEHEGEHVVEEEGWRTAYTEPYPSLQRLMRRVQDESLQILLREARVPVEALRGDEYTSQRMALLHQIEEQIGKERIALLAKQHPMDGKLHQIE